MAVEVTSESVGNVLGIRATGKMTDDDYKKTWVPNLEKLRDVHGAVRVLLYIWTKGSRDSSRG